MAGHVFISYVREDGDLADELCQILTEAGIPTWRDTASLWPGEDWRAKIRQAIRDEALVFLACFSRQSLSKVKSYQNEEVILALEELRLRRPDQPWLIPVRFDDCRIPAFEIGGGRMLTDLQQADLFGESRRQNADRLVMAIRRIIGPDTQPTVTPEAGGVGGSPAISTADQTPDREHGKYIVNIHDARGVQIGDGNVQRNKF